MIFIFNTAVDDIEEHYVFDKYKSASLSISPPSLKKEYNELENLKKAINEFFKTYNYAINIRDFDKNKKTLKTPSTFIVSKTKK